MIHKQPGESEGAIRRRDGHGGQMSVVLRVRGGWFMFCNHLNQLCRVETGLALLYALIDGPGSKADSAVMQNSGHWAAYEQ